MKPNTIIMFAVVFLLSLSMLAFAQSTTGSAAPAGSAAQSTEHQHHHDMEGMDCPCHKKAGESKDTKAEAKKDMKGCCADGKCKMGGECCKGEKGKSCCGGDEAKAGKAGCCGGKCDRKAHQQKAA